jgi:hypothetical protein
VKIISYLTLGSVVALMSLTACKTTPQMTNRPDFLSTYSHLKKIDTGVWRYVNPVLLRQCDKFVVSPVQVLFTEHNGQPITTEQHLRTADYIRQEIVKALSDRYPVVNEAGGPGVATIRIALTEAYRTKGKVGLGIEGEIVDNSQTQVAAVVRTEISQFYSPSWEEKGSAKVMVKEWASRLRKVIDEAHLK